MSLLMDALKKAEQEKKEAAKRLENTKDNATVPAEEPEAADPTGEHAFAEQSPPKHGSASATELTLAPIEHAETPAAQPGEAPAPLPGSEEPTLNRYKDELGAEEQAGSLAENEPAAEEPPAAPSGAPEKADLTFHGVDMDELVAESGLFEETVQGEPFQPGEATPSYDETLPGVPAAQLAKDIGGKDQPTPVAAETVFSATQSNKRSSLAFKVGLVASCLLLVVAASVGYFYWVTPVTPRVPSPWVARGIESVAPSPANAPGKTAASAGATSPATSSVKPAAAPATAAASTAAASAAAATTTTPPAKPAADTTQGGVQPAAAGSGAETAQNKAESPQTAQTAPAAATPEAASEAGKSAAAPGPVPKPKVAMAKADNSANGPPPERIQLPASAIQISRSKGPSQSGMTVKQAYEDYLAGHYKDARSKYLQVLGNDPDDSDAMLGVAAIDVKRGDMGSAVKWYGKVLSADPRNPYARAGLIAMGHTGAPEESESAVKTMLRNEPDNSFLYFILGNIYAGQQNWAQAQQAFFDAYRNDSSSADYAMNLAVSLDHMGQRQTALNYYNVALKLASKGNASFDPNAALARIRALKGQSSR